MNPIPGSLFRLPAQATQIPHLCDVSEMVPDLSRKNKALTRSSAGYRRTYAKFARVQITSTRSHEEGCAAHPKSS